MRYRKKPVVIDAWQWNGSTIEDLHRFNVENNLSFKTLAIRSRITGLLIETLEGDHIATKGDYIIRGVQGEYYPCKPDIFEATYERVE